MNSSDSLVEALRASLVSAFEDMAFTFVDWEESTEPPPPPTACAVVTCESAGHGRWRLILSVSPGLLPGVAANMLGSSPEDVSPDDQEDALRELTNVVCGNFLPSIAGSAAEWNVGMPVLCGDAVAAETPGDIRVEVRLEGGIAEARAGRMDQAGGITT